MAYKAYIKAHTEECATADTPQTCPGNITRSQLFFLTYARTQCRLADNATLIREITRPGYSHPRNRVNLAMQNFEEYAKEFNCTRGSNMYLSGNKTCSFW
ncbi:phosphate-regulating neutral endopeptidase PHEX-like [Dermacentor andersoni]|uniref:phosphate-regulating neutral endopeptidase PHEX-like n=1 Tax=Dermacentor andersoni TaxID=34620 RepID=UPI00241604A7|nr:phosphate-regulating neutral endopeptidase PHEX-like [Dermacentor andersoni]